MTELVTSEAYWRRFSVASSHGPLLYDGVTRPPPPSPLPDGEAAALLLRSASVSCTTRALGRVQQWFLWWTA